MTATPRRFSLVHMAPALLLLLLLLVCSQHLLHGTAPDEPAALHGADRDLLLHEEVETLPRHETVLCNPAVMGSRLGCFDAQVKAVGNDDLPWGHPEISYPTDGTPWGIHLTGPYPDGLSYLVSWMSGHPMVGPPSSLPKHDTSSLPAYVHLSKKSGALALHLRGGQGMKPGAGGHWHKGSVITYTRVYNSPGFVNYSYLSPFISHVLLQHLSPSTTYYYVVGKGKKWSEEHSFNTLPGPTSAKRYPLRIGLSGDVGQSLNSSTTRDRLLTSDPHLILMVGDNSYADNYDASSADFYDGDGSNQNRWDSYAVMWQPLAARVPVLNCIGNHEIERVNISAKITPSTTHFSYPTNYPFQSYAARYPVPGTSSLFGSIDSSLYYSTVVAGRVKVITLNSYVPFHTGTPQYEWAVKELRGLQRSITPWLIVQLHAAPYHTYFAHFKEMECFMSIWEDIFYMYSVDVVVSGHVHAYERTHPVFNYEQDACGPVYLTIGDGGNVEGPARFFVDQVQPPSNRTYCELLRTERGLSPVEVQAKKMGWGPLNQRAVQPPSCPTTTFQSGYGVSGAPPLMQLALNASNVKERYQGPRGFCQSSQPRWSAHRDPSFGHGLMELLDDDSLKLTWYRNVDPVGQHADYVQLTRDKTCANMDPHMKLKRVSKRRRHSSS